MELRRRGPVLVLTHVGHHDGDVHTGAAGSVAGERTAAKARDVHTQ